MRELSKRKIPLEKLTEQEKEELDEDLPSVPNPFRRNLDYGSG